MDNSEAQIMNRINEIKSQLTTIEGWLSDEGIENLYKYSLKIPVPIIVEIGSWKGKSTSCLAYAVKERKKGLVYAIDTWEGSLEHQETLKNYTINQLYNEFIENMTSLDLLDYIYPIKMDSIEASRNWPISRQIGLLYIDGSHDYLSVKNDFEFWSPLITTGGYIIFDDVPSWPGPTKLVNELPKFYRQLELRGNQVIFQKI